jgi:hypothetical protein
MKDHLTAMRWKICTLFTSMIHESHPDLEYSGIIEEVQSFSTKEVPPGMRVNDHGYIA